MASPFRPTPRKRQGPGGNFGTPAGLGGRAPAAPVAQAQDFDNDQDDDTSPYGDTDQDYAGAGQGEEEAPQQGGAQAVPSPESLMYYDEPQPCQTCQHMEDNGNCRMLQMEVSPQGHCNAYEAKGGEEEEGGEEQGFYGGPGGAGQLGGYG